MAPAVKAVPEKGRDTTVILSGWTCVPNFLHITCEQTHWETVIKCVKSQLGCPTFVALPQTWGSQGEQTQS